MSFNPFFDKPEKSGSQIFRVILVMMTVVLSFIVVVAQRAHRQMSNDLLLQGRLIKQSLDIRALRTLSGCSDDVEKAEYKRLKEQLIDFRSAHAKCRFLYLLGRRSAIGPVKTGGQVFIYLDSEREGSADFSPPGDLYPELSETDARVFNTKIPTVRGPIRDRWGMWITAFLPIIDSVTGDVIAVLGMDVDARAWIWDVFARAALPVSMMLVLLIAFATGTIAARSHNGTDTLKPIQQRLLMPLAAVLFLLAAGAVALLIKQHSDGLIRLSQKELQGVTAALAASTDQQAQSLAALGELMLRDGEVQKALKARDRKRLIHLCGPTFASLKIDRTLSECTFIDANRVCLLRLQALEQYGDRMDPFTLLEAERQGALASGLELGPSGLFSLRSVLPVYEGGMLIGYLELGKEIQDVLDALHAKKGTDFAIIIHKACLDRTRWEAGMRNVGREGEWDRFSDDVLVYSTLPEIPAGAGRFIEEQVPKGLSASTEMTSVGQSWRVMAVPLRDASAAEVGNLIVFSDMTEAVAAQNRLKAIGFGGGFVLLAGLLGFLHILLRRTDSNIRLQQSKLQKSEQRLIATLHSIGDGVITTDADGRITDLNTMAERLTKWTTAEAAGLPSEEIFRIVDALTRVASENPVEKAIRDKTTVELANHTLLIAKDGTEYQIADSCAPIRDARNQVIGAVLVFRDVTEEYRRRVALRASEERYRDMFEKNSSIQFLLDAFSGRIIDANPAACAFYGYTRERMKQLNISDINMEINTKNMRFCRRRGPKAARVLSFSIIWPTGRFGMSNQM